MWPFSTLNPETASGNTPDASECPVDHTKWSSKSTAESACPVDHSQWSGAVPPHSLDREGSGLSTTREISTIPRYVDENGGSGAEASAHPPAESSAAASGQVEKWVYPSPASFYSALKRKNQNPEKRDMNVVVPIHNAVNERVWTQVMTWENLAAPTVQRISDLGVGTKLVSFVGRPKELSPKAWFRSLLGYTTPFDRHDWVVDRPLSTDPADRRSMRMRYVIDFYTGKAAPNSPYSFFIDCRPALDSWEGVRMRGQMLWRRWTGGTSDP